MLLAARSMPWEMHGDICFPNLLDPWCVSAIPWKWSWKVLVGEGGTKDTEAARCWLPCSPCHAAMERAGRDREKLEVEGKPQPQECVLGIFRNVGSVGAGSLPWGKPSHSEPRPAWLEV